MRFLTAGMIGAIALTIVTPAIAQERQGCWIEWPGGAVISLDALCPMPAPEAPAAVPVVAPVAAPVSGNARELAIAAYSDAYCRERRDGVGHDFALNGARAAMSSQLVGSGVSVDTGLILEAQGAIALLCPEFDG